MCVLRRAFAATLLLGLAAVHVATPAFAQCSTDPNAPPDVVGTWEWSDTNVGGFTGETITPENAGYAVQVEFRDDGTMRVYRDHVLVHSTTYRLFLGRFWTVIGGAGSMFPHPPRPTQAGQFCLSIQATPNGLQLMAYEPCVECFISRFVARDPVPVAAPTWAFVKNLYQG